MANVQCENGYTKIANEILEGIAKIKLSPTQYRLTFIIWRYTYGFNRKEHNMSLTFLSNATGCDKRQIQRELKDLEEKNIIKQNIKSGSYRKISFNKDYEMWVTDGETTIGEITIGETDNGETINTAIGETVKATIGETTNQERKKEKLKESAYSSEFETWWKEYPNKKEKKRSYSSFKTARKKHSFEVLLEGLRGYVQYLKKSNTPDKFIKHASTFLNGESFKDYLTVKTKPSNVIQFDDITKRKLELDKRLQIVAEQMDLNYMDEEKFRELVEEFDRIKEELKKFG